MVIYIYETSKGTFYKLAICDIETNEWAHHFISENIFNALKDKIKVIDKR